MQTEMFEVDPLSDNRKLYVRAAEALAAGALVGIPTETVYGLGADALNPEAVARVFEAKGRPSFDPLIIHVHHGKEVDKYTAIPEELKELVHTLASKFWPGPLTMVLPKADIIPDIVTSGLPTVAVRVSAHPAMRGAAQRQPLRPYQPYFRLRRAEGAGWTHRNDSGRRSLLRGAGKHHRASHA